MEGNIYPEFIEALLLSPRHAVWLVPSETFKLESFYRRGKHEGKQVSDLEQANRNHLDRDNVITKTVKERALARDLEVLEVDDSLSLDQVVEVVARHFGPGADSG